MTINEAITQTDALKPNQYETAEKVRWLNTLDGRIAAEVYANREGVTSEFTPYDSEGDLADELLASEPYTDIYPAYLCAQIDYYNGETGRYNNSMVVFNMAFEAFANWVNRTYRSVPKSHVRLSL